MLLLHFSNLVAICPPAGSGSGRHWMDCITATFIIFSPLVFVLQNIAQQIKSKAMLRNRLKEGRSKLGKKIKVIRTNFYGGMLQLITWLRSSKKKSQRKRKEGNERKGTLTSKEAKEPEKKKWPLERGATEGGRPWGGGGGEGEPGGGSRGGPGGEWGGEAWGDEGASPPARRAGEDEHCAWPSAVWRQTDEEKERNEDQLQDWQEITENQSKTEDKNY